MLSRAWCHLCDEMRIALEPIAANYPFDLEILDVDANPALAQRYGEDVPVLLAGRVELSRHRLDSARVAAYLANIKLTSKN